VLEGRFVPEVSASVAYRNWVEKLSAEEIRHFALLDLETEQK
jgi:hypothetical protein